MRGSRTVLRETEGEVPTVHSPKYLLVENKKAHLHNFHNTKKGVKMSRNQEIINNGISYTNLLEEITSNGLNNICEIIEQLINEAMKIERNHHINANHYERSADRRGYANGFKPKRLHTRIGALDLSVPQVRDSEEPFYPKSLEKGTRSERALKLAVSEMYIQGVSTRKVEAVLKKLCGLEISSTEVSRCSQLMDEELEKFRNRSLDQQYAYIYFDAQYHKVRHNRSIISVPVLLAAGVTEEGNREIIGISTSLSEAEVHWREFFKSLQKRGLHGVALFISDDHAGLKKALQAVFPSVPWQRCLFHLAQNAQSYAPKKSMKGEIAEAVKMDLAGLHNLLFDMQLEGCIEQTYAGLWQVM